MRESIKAVIERLVDSSVTNGCDKKAEWTKTIKEVEEAELQQTMKNALANTKGKHGRRTILQEERSLDDLLSADDKQALKESIRTALNDMEHEYETAYIKAALIRSGHLDPNTPFAVFLRSICDFSGKEYKYDLVRYIWEGAIQDFQEFQVATGKKNSGIFDGNLQNWRINCAIWSGTITRTGICADWIGTNTIQIWQNS